MSKLLLQRILLIVGVIALIIVLIDGAVSIAATMPSNTAVRVEHVTAGPYHLVVSMYTYPANAGFALPFAIAPEQPVKGTLSFHVDSLPGANVDANPVRATFSADPKVHNGIQGAAEITVKGPWSLQVQVDGSAGRGIASVPVTAVAFPPIPTWLGWLIGFIPFYVLIVFLVVKYVGQTPMSEEEDPLLEQAEVGSAATS